MDREKLEQVKNEGEVHYWPQTESNPAGFHGYLEPAFWCCDQEIQRIRTWRWWEQRGGGGETNTKKYLHKESALKQTGFPCDNIVNEPIHGYVAASQNHQHIKCTLTIKASQCLPTVFTIKAELYSHLLQHVYVRGHFSTAMLPYGLVNRQQKKIMVWSSALQCYLFIFFIFLTSSLALCTDIYIQTYWWFIKL